MSLPRPLTPPPPLLLDFVHVTPPCPACPRWPTCGLAGTREEPAVRGSADSDEALLVHAIAVGTPPRRRSQTSFCGYSMPHPSETRVQMRVQTRGEPAVEVTGRALGKLATAADTIRERFTAAVAAKAAAEGSSSSSA